MTPMVLGGRAIVSAAAIPVLEVLVAIPTVVLAGMSPGPTTLLALAGNLSTVVLVGAEGGRGPAGEA